MIAGYKFVFVVVIRSSSTRILLSLPSSLGALIFTSVEVGSISISDGASDTSVAGDDVTDDGGGLKISLDIKCFGVMRPSNDESGLGQRGDGVWRQVINDGDGLRSIKIFFIGGGE